MLQVLKRTVRRWLGPGDAAELSQLHSVEKFRALLDRERARVDRRGGEFCVVTFRVAADRDAAAGRQRVANILAKRLRVTDDFGWLENGQIAALLTDTPPKGANIVATDVCSRVGEGHTPPKFMIQHYQDEQVSPPAAPMNGHASNERNGNGQHPPHSNGTHHGDRQGETKVSDNGHRSESNGSSNGIALIQRIDLALVAIPATESLAQLFVRPMPIWKRAIDIVGSSVGLILLTPLFVFVALVIRRSSSGPVFYTNPRSGRGGKPFEMYKFRSMVANADELKQGLMDQNEQDGPAFKIQNDPRVTPFGRFIRKTSIDELPQLWNVLKGEMSLVGPRPLPVAETERSLAWHRRRLDVTPGLTCIWQVRGRSRVEFDEWVRMDIEYIEARTLWSDLKLLFLTVPAVLLRRGAQ